MTKLSDINCEACRADATKLDEADINEQMTQLPGWTVINEDNINKLQKTFEFKNFVDALAFTNKVGALAEEHGHHPDILTEWGKVTVTWWSHKINGLHQLDFLLAYKTAEL